MKLRLFIALTLAICCGYSATAQKTTRLVYRTTTGSGLTEVTVDVTARLVNSFGDIQLVYSAECSGNLEYFYKGREWTFAGSDAAIRNIKPIDPVVTFEVTGPGGFSKTIKAVITSALGASLFGNSSLVRTAKTAEERKPEAYTVTPIEVNRVSYENSLDVQSELDARLREEEKRSQVNALTSKGATALQLNQLAEAEAYYQELKKLDPENTLAGSQLSRIGETKKQQAAKQRVDDLADAANKAEQSGDLEGARKFLDEAAKIPGEGERVQQKLNRVNGLLDDRKREAADNLKKQEQAAADALNAKTAAAASRQKTEEKAREEREAAAEEQQQKEADALKNELESDQQAAFAEQQTAYREQKEKDRADRERRMKESAQRETAALQAWDQRAIAEAMDGAAPDYEAWLKYSADARRLLQDAHDVDPAGALDSRAIRWDEFGAPADDAAEQTYQQQRTAYLNRLTDQSDAMNQAKLTFLRAIRFTEPGSDEYDYAVRKIAECSRVISRNSDDRRMEYASVSVLAEARERNRFLKEAQKSSDRNRKAALAAEAFARNSNSAGEASAKQFDLANRMEAAEKTYETEQKASDQLFGSAFKLAESIRADDAVFINKGSLMNFSLGANLVQVPTLLNYTYDVGSPHSEVGTLDGVGVSTALDFWALRSKVLDFNLGIRGNVSISPSVGASSYYASGAGRTNLDFGYRRFKIATTGEYVYRIGAQKLDMDVSTASNGGTASGQGGKMTGEFTYSVLRVGAGIKIDMSDEKRDSHLWINVFAEKPDFYPESILKKPIYSYQAELVFFKGLGISATYGQNYVVAGKKDYPLESAKNGSYSVIELFKSWTLFKHESK